MTFTPKTEEAITKFAKETIKNTLDKNELSYFERLELKARELQEKTKKNFSTNREEDVEELTSYMRDYMNQLVAEEHLSEADALEKAKSVFYVKRTRPEEEKELERIAYYESIDPATEEAIGLAYGSRIILGIVLGAIIGILGQIYYDGTIWGIVLWIMIGLGMLLGVGLGLASHAGISKSRGK